MTARQAKIKALQLAADRTAGYPDQKVSAALRTVEKELLKKAENMQKSEDRAAKKKAKATVK
jgi:hypothetical protein